MGQIKPRARELWQALKDCAKFRQQISICFINQMCNVRNLRKVLEFRHRIFKCKQLKLLHAQDYFKCNDSSKIRSRGFSAYEDRLAAAPRTPVCPETLTNPCPGHPCRPVQWPTTILPFQVTPTLRQSSGPHLPLKDLRQPGTSGYREPTPPVSPIRPGRSTAGPVGRRALRAGTRPRRGRPPSRRE